MEKLQGKKPQVRFPEFKEAWEHIQLSELLSEAKKRNGDLKYDKDEVLSVSGELGIVNQIEHLGRSYAGVSVHQYHVVEVGDIVYTKSPLKANPYGIIKLNKRKAGIVSTLYAVYTVNKKSACGEFVEHYFSLDANTNRYLRPLVKKGAKNDMKISNAYVLHDRIFAPNVTEQKRIASFFSVLDDKIEQHKKKKNLLEQYKKGIMQKIFSQQLRFKDENGKTFPKWEQKKLREITDVITKGTTPNNFTDDGIKFIKIECLDGESINQTKCLFIDNNTHFKELKRSILNDGDIIFAIAGATIGKCNIITKEVLPANVNQALAIVRLKKKVNRQFVYQILKSEKMQKYIVDSISVGAQPNLNLEQMNNFSIPYPLEQEQIKITNFLCLLDAKINQTEIQIQKAMQYKKGLLQKMFI